MPPPPGVEVKLDSSPKWTAMAAPTVDEYTSDDISVGEGLAPPAYNSLPQRGRWIDKAFSRSQDGRGRVLQYFKPLPSLLRKSTLPQGEGFLLV